MAVESALKFPSACFCVLIRIPAMSHSLRRHASFGMAPWPSPWVPDCHGFRGKLITAALSAFSKHIKLIAADRFSSGLHRWSYRCRLTVSDVALGISTSTVTIGSADVPTGGSSRASSLLMLFGLTTAQDPAHPLLGASKSFKLSSELVYTVSLAVIRPHLVSRTFQWDEPVFYRLISKKEVGDDRRTPNLLPKLFVHIFITLIMPIALPRFLCHRERKTMTQESWLKLTP